VKNHPRIPIDSKPRSRRLSAQVATQIRAADRRVDRGQVGSPGDYLYAEYATAKHLAGAAPPAVRRVGDTLDG
jgi:hypothetical protein